MRATAALCVLAACAPAPIDPIADALVTASNTELERAPAARLAQHVIVPRLSREAIAEDLVLDDLRTRARSAAERGHPVPALDAALSWELDFAEQDAAGYVAAYVHEELWPGTPLHPDWAPLVDRARSTPLSVMRARLEDIVTTYDEIAGDAFSDADVPYGAASWLLHQQLSRINRYFYILATGDLRITSSPIYDVLIEHHIVTSPIPF